MNYINIHTAEMFISTGGERETLAYAEQRGLLKNAMAVIRAHHRFAEAVRVQISVRHA